ncbi:Pectin degradation repressor protein KdgR (plasmid) [Variovorax sp. SRS16]|uniref:IclR family transcriptional regulator n=1 Tax=Variovorax sp. SRS16 TaxID=282217 RepID=UPI0013176C7E|nr:IclR family transcriptional regulator [Variovorax sp. SRS16]VTU46612.1 Pectin degradation repressor protein KdgR [Variovorax sp. SRS16]
MPRSPAARPSPPKPSTRKSLPPGEKKLNSVEAVKVAVRVLDELALAQRAMGVTELAEALGETKPRVHRHLSTLREVGLIEQDQATDRYRLGWRVFQLGEAAGTQFDLRSRAEPYLLRLRDELKETSVLAVPINGRPMVIATTDNIYARICISVKPGNRPLPHCSALGRLTLAFSPAVLQEEMLSAPMTSETPQSMTDPARIRKRLGLIHEQFYEVCNGEMMLGVNTIAVPIFRNGDVLAGALSIVGSIQNVPNPPRRKQVETLQACAAELSAQLNSDAYQRWQLRRKAHGMLNALV